MTEVLNQNTYELLVEVRHREKIADPEGSTINKALHALGFNLVEKVSVGKAIRLLIKSESEQAAVSQAEDICKRLLANPVLENYFITLIKQKTPEEISSV